MPASTGSLLRFNVDHPDEVRPYKDNGGHLDVINTPHGVVGRGVFEPGWRWSKNVKPIAGTESCQAAHMGYVVSGRMTVVMDGGDRQEFGPGDVMICPPGHDAWVDGNEACVMIDWTGASNYAKPAS